MYNEIIEELNNPGSKSQTTPAFSFDELWKRENTLVPHQEFDSYRLSEGYRRALARIVIEERENNKFSDYLFRKKLLAKNIQHRKWLLLRWQERLYFILNLIKILSFDLQINLTLNQILPAEFLEKEIMRIKHTIQFLAWEAKHLQRLIEKEEKLIDKLSDILLKISPAGGLEAA